VTVPFPPEWHVDGGVTHNNPSPFALKEGNELWKTKRCLLVSVGTGIQKRADFLGNKKTPEAESDPKNEPSIEAGPVESQQSVEGTSDAAPTQSPTPKFGGIKGDLQTRFQKRLMRLMERQFASRASTRILQELVKLSTESEKTHGTMYAEAHSKDLAAQFWYYRFNVQSGMDDIGLEEWQNWDLMVSVTQNYLNSVDVPARLTECARDLLYPPGFESI